MAGLVPIDNEADIPHSHISQVLAPGERSLGAFLFKESSMQLVTFQTREYGTFTVNADNIHAFFAYRENPEAIPQVTVILLPGGAQHVNESYDEVFEMLLKVSSSS